MNKGSGRRDGWEAYRRLRAAGLPITTTKAKAAVVNDTTEKVARAAYLELSPRDKVDVDPWLDLGNNYLDSLINSGVLTKPRRTDRMSPRDAREVFHGLPWQHKNVVREWLAVGHDLPDAIANSNSLGNGPLTTPREARHEQIRIMHRLESAHHESAHAVAAHALGLDVKSARIGDDHSGECIHVSGTNLQNAIVLVAPEIWIGRFMRDRFPYGPTGLKADHRALIEIGDEFVVKSAVRHCVELLKQNRAILLETADQILTHGGIVAPWL